MPALLLPDGRLQIETAPVFVPLLNKTRYRGARGGRGSGKSHFFAEDLIADTLADHVRAVCAREVQNSIKESSKQLIEDKLRDFGVYSQFDVTDYEIRYPLTDSLYTFRGLQNYTSKNIKSLEGYNRFWCDEAQTLSQRSVELVTPTFRENNATMDFSWNPYSPKDAVERLFNENQGDPDFNCVTANYYDNPWLPEALHRDMERDRRRDPDKYQHVWLGKYRRMSQAAVFRNWRVEKFDTPPDVRFYFGADWGFSVDPSVLIRCWVDPVLPRTLRIDREAYAVGCEIDYLPALFAGDDKRVPPQWDNPKGYKGIPGALDWPITADSARPETIAYLAKRGFKIKPAIKGKRSVEEGIEFLQSYDIIIHSDCVYTIDEFASYSYKVDEKTQEVLPQLADKDNHVIDAARYGLESLIRQGSWVADYL